jgi:hypothetical protein
VTVQFRGILTTKGKLKVGTNSTLSLEDEHIYFAFFLHLEVNGVELATGLVYVL